MVAFERAPHSFKGGIGDWANEVVLETAPAEVIQCAGFTTQQRASLREGFRWGRPGTVGGTVMDSRYVTLRKAFTNNY